MNQQSAPSRLGWQSRPATSRNDGTGFFTLVGGYEVLVYEKQSGRPVSGALIIAGSLEELKDIVERRLSVFEPLFEAQSPQDREANMVIAARTARQCGWEWEGS